MVDDMEKALSRTHAFSLKGEVICCAEVPWCSRCGRSKCWMKFITRIGQFACIVHEIVFSSTIGL
jgi:hypothetical protein